MPEELAEAIESIGLLRLGLLTSWTEVQIDDMPLEHAENLVIVQRGMLEYDKAMTDSHIASQQQKMEAANAPKKPSRTR